MEREELLRRADELSRRCEKNYSVVSTFFLTPAEQSELEKASRSAGWQKLVFSGGNGDCERKAAFFLPDFMEADSFDPKEYISAVSAVTRFAQPSHRDYLGALLGLGIKREFLGDISVDGEQAYFYCLPSVLKHILLSLDRIGKYSVKIQEIALSSVPTVARRTENLTFTVKSPRLDAVLAGMFNISRQNATELIASGAVSLNFRECLKSDADVSSGDIISARGYGKCKLTDFGGLSRKGRIFLNAEFYK